jgi:hypothetical protein
VARGDPRHCACRRRRHLQRAEQRPACREHAGQRRHLRIWLCTWLGFTAGWMFLCAKTASAATAALGFAGYLLQTLDVAGSVVLVSVAAVVTLTCIVLMGIQRSNRAPTW